MIKLVVFSGKTGIYLFTRRELSRSGNEITGEHPIENLSKQGSSGADYRSLAFSLKPHKFGDGSGRQDGPESIPLPLRQSKKKGPPEAFFVALFGTDSSHPAHPRLHHIFGGCGPVSLEFTLENSSVANIIRVSHTSTTPQNTISLIRPNGESTSASSFSANVAHFTP